MKKLIIPLSSIITWFTSTHKKNLALSGQLRSRMLDLGFINDTVVEALYCSPWG